MPLHLLWAYGGIIFEKAALKKENNICLAVRSSPLHGDLLSKVPHKAQTALTLYTVPRTSLAPPCGAGYTHVLFSTCVVDSSPSTS